MRCGHISESISAASAQRGGQRVAKWSPEELAEMAAADAEIEATFRLTNEDLALCARLDKAARAERLDSRRRKESDRQKAWYAANRAKVLAKQKAYKEANREKIAAQQKVYRAANREKISDLQKAWYQANRERVLAKQKEYQEANRERIAEYQRAYRRRRAADHGEIQSG